MAVTGNAAVAQDLHVDRGARQRSKKYTLSVDQDFDGVSPCGPDGDASTLADGDCDDADVSIYPGAAELCDGIDSDCDGNVDENYLVENCGQGACAAGSVCLNGVETACQEGAPLNNVDDTCDGTDDDCDGQTDEGYVAQNCGDGVCAAAKRTPALASWSACGVRPAVAP